MTPKQIAVLQALIKLADEHWAQFCQIYQEAEGEELDESDFVEIGDLSQ